MILFRTPQRPQCDSPSSRVIIIREAFFCMEFQTGGSPTVAAAGEQEMIQ